MANQTIIALDLSSSTVTSVTLSDYYAPKADPVFTGTVNIGGATSVSLPTNTTIGSVSSTELGYLANVTSDIQSQLSTISLSGSVTGNVILPQYVANSAGAIVFEGSSVDNNQLFLIPTNPASDVYLTLPAITDTVVTKTTTDTFTNKTFDTSATGNVFRVNGNGITAVTGTGSTAVLSASPTITGTATVADLTISGNLTVNGTTTTINSTTLTVDDKLIELGDVASPTNTTANGGGLLLKAGAGVDKTILWDSTNANWTSSENFNLPTGKTFKINNVTLLDTNAPKTMATLMGYTSTATSGTAYVLNNTSSYYQQFTGSTAQTITLPVTSTLITGWTFHLVNNNTSGDLTVNSSGGNLVITVVPGTTAMVTCIGTTLTTAADWEAGLTDFSTSTGSGAVVLGTSPTINTSIITGSNFTLGAAATTLSIGSGASAATLNLFNGGITTGAKSINIGTGGTGGTTAINIGSSAGSTTTVTMNADTLTGNVTSMSIFNATQTTINSFAAATTLNIGNYAGGSNNTISIGAGANATSSKTINIGTNGTTSTSTTLNLGNATGTLATSTINLSGKIIRPATSQNVSSWTTSGQAFDITSTTFTDTSTGTSGVVATRALNSWQTQTLASTNAITVTEAANLYIAGAVSAGTNTTITRSHSILVAGGLSAFRGGIAVSAPTTNSSATYTVSATDTYIINTVDSTITLPTASANTGRIIWLKTTTAQTIISNASNVVLLASTTAGTAILSNATSGKFVQLVSDGTNWIAMSSN
jgi:hypothetical protein